MNRKSLFVILLFTLALSVLPVLADTDNHNDQSFIGSWALDRVYEYASSSEPIELDPENAASLYAEKRNIYSFYGGNHYAFITTNEGGDSITQTYNWEGKADTFILHEDGLDLEFYYDKQTGNLHRYWAETATDSMYHDLDFVYTRVPVCPWKLEAVYSTVDETNPVRLEPETSASLYAEKDNVYFLLEDGSASVLVNTSDDVSYFAVGGQGRWERDGDTYHFDVEGFEMELFYDTKENRLHRSLKDANDNAMYPSLDFVYYPINF